MKKILAVELSDEFAPFPPSPFGDRFRVLPLPMGGDTIENRPLRIEAHAGSSVIIGGKGHTTASSTSGAADELESELLRVFRSFPLRDRLNIMETLYRRESMRQKTEKAPTTEGRDKRKCGLLRCRLTGRCSWLKS